jgi:similar to stage IV sporulation protein
MLDDVVECLRGQVRVRVTAAFPERVMNLCGERNLRFWDVTWASPRCFSCTLSRRDFAVLRRCAQKLECTLEVRRRRGVPYFLRRFRRRYALLAGAAVCAAALTAGSFFIWDFTVEGNAAVSDEEILRVLQKNGVDVGTFCFSLDAEDLRNHVLLEIPELSWLTVNVSGCQAHVVVRERVPRPALADQRTPANLVARRDGLVLSTSTLGGVAAVLPGDTVVQGQLLISGVRDTGTFGARLSAGTGAVTARTWYTLRAAVPLTASQKVYAERSVRRFSLVFGTRRINFYRNSSGPGENYDKISSRKKLSLLGLPLPLTAQTETLRPYTLRETVRTPDQARAEGEAVLTAYLHTLVDPYGTVSSTLCQARESGGALQVTLRAECTEQIGVPSPILTEGKG